QLEAEDPDGDMLDFAVVEDPAHGTVEIDADGSFRYTPAHGAMDADSFSFSVDDGFGGDDALSGVVAMPDGRVAVSGDSGGEWAVVAGYSVRGTILSPWGEGGS